MLLNVYWSMADFHKGDMESAQIITLTLELPLYIRKLREFLPHPIYHSSEVNKIPPERNTDFVSYT